MPVYINIGLYLHMYTGANICISTYTCVISTNFYAFLLVFLADYGFWNCKYKYPRNK